MPIERILWAISIYGKNHKQGLVELRLDEKRVQLSIQEAKDFAFSILEAAEAAETDAFLVDFMGGLGSKNEDEAVQLLMLFRDFRDKKKREKPLPGGEEK